MRVGGSFCEGRWKGQLFLAAVLEDGGPLLLRELSVQIHVPLVEDLRQTSQNPVWTNTSKPCLVEHRTHSSNTCVKLVKTLSGQRRDDVTQGQRQGTRRSDALSGRHVKREQCLACPTRRRPASNWSKSWLHKAGAKMSSYWQEENHLDNRQ